MNARRIVLWATVAVAVGALGVFAPDALLRSLKIGFSLFYKALWPILFGVLITAGIETFLHKEKMAQILGGRDLLTTSKASVAGAVSSACTFGAVTISQTLFKKGASAESTFAFSFASTNLVFELGILIYILLGPAFLAAELLGGVVLIAIMYLIVRYTLPEHVFAEARERLQGSTGGDGQPAEDPFCDYPGNEELSYTHDGVTYRFHSKACREAFRQQVASRGDWKQQLKTFGGWYRIAVSYFNTMSKIYKTVIYGFVLAGFIVGLVPAEVWATVFLEPTNFFAVVENAVLGVLAAVLSFIGSIGNVPFAAALWVSGVSFAGVIACIYADLITVPVLQLWGQFFGRKAMWYIFGVFAATMTISAVIMEYLFAAFGWIPDRPGADALVGFNVKLNFTFVMTILVLALTAALYVTMLRGRHHAEQEQDDAESATQSAACSSTRTAPQRLESAAGRRTSSVPSRARGRSTVASSSPRPRAKAVTQPAPAVLPDHRIRAVRGPAARRKGPGGQQATLSASSFAGSSKPPTPGGRTSRAPPQQ